MLANQGTTVLLTFATYYFMILRHGSTVSIAWMIEELEFESQQGQDLSLLHVLQTSSAAQCAGVSLPGGEVAAV
jgi:hypothetical protein